jgi:peptidyl-dipeptidase Dcp
MSASKVSHLSIAAVLALASGPSLLGCGASAGSKDSMNVESSAQGAGSADSTKQATDTNPFFAASTLYLQAPHFDRIKNEHFRPAFDEGMRQHLAEVRAIADNTEAPTFENTIVAMERTGALLTRVRRVFFNLTESTTNPEIQKIQAEVAPLLAKHMDAILLDAPLFARIQKLYAERAGLGLGPVETRLLERYRLDFVRGGAELSEEGKTKLRALNEEESKLTTQFSEFLLKETNASAVIVENVAELEGLSPADIESAAVAAKERGMEGKWVLPLINTTGQPSLVSLKNRALRERIFKASTARSSRGGEFDTLPIVTRLATLRTEKAQLLGFKNFARFVLDDQMAKTPEAALKLLKQLGPKAAARARAEIADMQKVINTEKGGFKLAPWDWDHYAEKVRKAKYDLDEAEIRPYFELDRVLKDGVFFAANKLYGVTVKQRTDLPVYHPDVRVWEIFDADGSTIGLLYTDYFARESKRGGAWMDAFVDQSDLLGTKPVIVNVLNVPKPAAGQPALLSYDEVTTLFHEFGHAVHGLFSKVRYPYMSGTNTPRDFVEFPSQFNENWILEPTVLANYAKHHKTGEAMPEALVAKIKNASKFNQGFATLEVLKAALLDMEWHARTTTEPVKDVPAFEKTVFKKYGVDLAEVPPRYKTAYFAHIWPGGYGTGYYAYLWTAVLGADSFAWFGEHGGMTAENGKLFRDGVLSKGGTLDAKAMYLAFRGSEPKVEPLIKQRGL